MHDEPRGELARYAFGYSDKKPGWFWWIIHLMMVAFILWVLLHSSAFAAGCRKHSIWHYPWPQRCYTAYAPAPLVHRAEEQSHDWSVEIEKLPPTWNLDEPIHIEVTVPAPTPAPLDNDRAHGVDKLKELMK